MSRHAAGWKIRQKANREIYDVRFTHNKRAIERSTGSSDPVEAAEAAARIYADFVHREPATETPAVVRRGDSPPLEELVALWLASDSTIGARTVSTWTVYGGHWREKWESLVHVTDVTIQEYRNARLRIVLADTIRKELSALRRFLEWCLDNAYLSREILVCAVPRKASGTRFEKRRRRSAPELSPEQIEGILAALPEWAAMGTRKTTVHRAPNRFAVRARFIVAYETGLRPSFLDELRVPDHYRKGSTEVTILVEVDKNQYQRQVPLTERAREALDSVCPDIGLVFGKHDYRIPIGRAAAKVLPPEKAAIFTSAHFRSAQATHTLEATGNIPGAMHLFGWTQVATASRYAKPSQRAAEDAIRQREELRSRARPKKRGKRPAR